MHLPDFIKVKTQAEFYINLNKPMNLTPLGDTVWKETLSTWLICGSLWLLLNVPEVKGEMTIGSIVLPLKWPRLLLYHFPRDCWRPSALQVSNADPRTTSLILQAHRELLHDCLLILCQRDKSEWEEHGKFSHAVWQGSVRKICQDNEVKCDKCYRPWELCSLLGCLDLLLFHNAFKKGKILKACLGESSLTECFLLRSRHGDYGYIASTWS